MCDDSAHAFHARATRKKETRRDRLSLYLSLSLSLRAAKCVRVRLHARVRARGCIGGDRRMKEADIGREKDKILSLSLSLGKLPKDLLPQKYLITTLPVV